MRISRAHFRESQILRYSDLKDEQAYRIAMRRRHNLAHHRWGIVQGLVLEATRMGVTLSPGFAVDGYGRELVVTRVLELRRQLLENVLNGAEMGFVDVWLTYRVVASDDPKARCYEDAWVRLDCAGVGDNEPYLVDPRRPWEVPSTDLDFGPEQEPPDAPEREWPVYLGRIAVGMGDRTAPPYSSNAVVLTELAYATLVGASLQTPNGYPWMQIGDEEAADNRRFAISLPDDKGKPRDRLVIGRDGGTSFWGRSQIAPAHTDKRAGDGDLALIGIEPEQGAALGIELAALEGPPETARPWQLYRTSAELKRSESADRSHKVQQLRVETFHPGEEGDPQRSALVIGQRQRIDDEDTFFPELTVRSDGTVTIEHDLHVQGQLIEGAVPADLEDERFRDQVLERWTKGLTLAGTEVDAFYEIPLRIGQIEVRGELGEIEAVPAGETFTYSIGFSHTGDTDRNVPIVTVLGEFRDETRRLIQSETMDEIPTEPLTPASGSVTVRKETSIGIAGAVTLTVRVVALGAAQNVVEKTVNTVIDITPAAP